MRSDKSKPSLMKTILWAAGAHITFILLLLYSPSFQEKKVPEKTLQWVDLPSPQTTAVENSNPKVSAPSTSKRSEIPIPKEIGKTDPQPIAPEPVKPKPEPIKPKPQPTPKNPKRSEVPTPKEVVEKPKPRPVEVDLTKVVKQTTTNKASYGNTNTLTEQLSDSLDMIQMKNTAISVASPSTIKAYHLKIRNAIYRAWKRPRGGPRPLEALVTLRILPDGTIIFIRLAKSSGHEAMDHSVTQAAQKAGKVSSPLPAGMGSPDYQVTINFIQK